MENYLPLAALYGLVAAIELGVAFLFFRLNSIRQSLLFWVLIANFVSAALIMLVQTGLAGLLVNLYLATIIAWAGAVVIEALVLHFPNHKQISLNQSFALSLIANLASLVLVLSFLYQGLGL